MVPVDYIESTPGVCGGKPRIAGTRIKVSLVARLYAQGQSVDEIIEAYPHLTLAQVHAALTYYYDRQVEIEAEIREADEYVADFMKQHPASVLGS